MTKEGIIRMAREIFDVTTDDRGRETFSADSFGIQRMAALVAVIEREACAKVCDEVNQEYGGEEVSASWIAAAIRARSNT